MSAFSTIADALLSHWSTAVAGIDTSRDEIAIEQLSPDWTEHVQVVSALRSISPADWGQRQQTFGLTFLYVSKTKTASEVHTVLDAVEALIKADRTLSASVDRAEETEAVVPASSGKGYAVGVLTVEASSWV